MPSDSEWATSDAATWLFVPALLRPRMAVELGLPLWAVGGLAPSVIAPDSVQLRPGVVIVHSQRFDRPAGAYGPLESGGTTQVGGHIVETVATPDINAWVLRVR